MAFKYISSLFTALFIVVHLSFGQTILIEKASDAMKELDYVTAIRLCLDVLNKNDGVPEAQMMLADCYRKINDTRNAEDWYEKVVKLPNIKPIYHLYYGMMLQSNGKCKEAKPWLQQYLKENPADARGQALAQSCEQEQILMTKNSGMYVVKHLTFNSRLDDYSPTIYGNKLIFSSDREHASMIKRTTMWTGNPFSEFYEVTFDTALARSGDFRFGEPVNFSKKLNSKFNDAAIAFAPDSQVAYFTRNNLLAGKTGRSEEGLVKLNIYAATKDAAGQWSNLQSLSINSDQYNTAHPTVSADGKRLYFSSNMPGGFGGMDLYVCEWENGHWGPPVNLGGVVNSEGNEIFPYIASDNRLYFSSDGHIGLGGLDIFYTSNKGKKDDWNVPVNLGAPINSYKDDFGITFGSDMTWGFFSTDRDENGAEQDDIWGFTKNAAPVEIQVVDAQTKAPLSGVTITNSITGLAMTTGSDGKIGFDMRFAECADFSAVRKGYETKTKRGCTDSLKHTDITRIDIVLQKQANFTVSGLVFDMADGLPAEGATVMLNNDCGKPLAEPVVTGSDGRFKFKLDKECCYSLRAVLDGYIAGVSNSICTKAIQVSTNFKSTLNLEPYQGGETSSLLHQASGEYAPKYNPNSGYYENKDGQPANYDLGNGLVVKSGLLFDNGVLSRPEKSAWERSSKEGFLINLYYDFNQTAISEASKPEVEHLLRTLFENPELKVEIASHTDSRGSDEYNLQLSQLRAEAVVDWLSGHGIDRGRLIAHGYGETQPVNHCTNGIPCSEQEHSMNRRTEFRIRGKDSSLISKPKDGVKVAPCAGCPF